MRKLAVLIFAFGFPAHADVIELRADPWCPYVCEDPDRPGFMVEIAREALGFYGHEINFEFVSWSRAIYQAETGDIDGIVGGVPDEAPGLVWSGPVAPFSDAVAFRSGEAIEVREMADLDGLRLGLIKDYDYYGAINDYMDAHIENRNLVQFAAGEKPLETNLRKLLAGRLDAVADTESVILHMAAELGISDEIAITIPSGSSFVELGFSPSNENSAMYVAQLNEGMERLRTSGRWEEIMSAYGQ